MQGHEIEIPLLKATLCQLLIVVFLSPIVSDVTPRPPPQESLHRDKDAGGGALQRPPPLRNRRPRHLPCPRGGSSFSSPPRCSFCAEPRRSATWPIINATGCGAKSSPFGGAVVPIRGRARCHWHRPGPGSPPCNGVAKERQWEAEPGTGAGARVLWHIVPGGIRQRHCRTDTGSHRPGPTQVRGMAWQPPAPCRRDKGCCCRSAAAGPLSWPCPRLLGRPQGGTQGSKCVLS